MRLIDADALINALSDEAIQSCFIADAKGIIKLLKDAPTIKEESDDYIERFRAEYKQLNKRMERLNDYISHYKKEIKSIELYLYEKQLEAMIAYRNVLELRASLDNIDLAEVNRN